MAPSRSAHVSLPPALLVRIVWQVVLQERLEHGLQPAQSAQHSTLGYKLSDKHAARDPVLRSTAGVQSRAEQQAKG